MNKRILKYTFALVVALGLTFWSISSNAKQSAQQSRFRNKKSVTLPKQYSKDFNVVEEDGKKVLYRKRYNVEFDESLIQGDVKNPSEFYFVHRPEEKFGSLLERRKNFNKEMLRDTVMIR